MSNPHLTTKKFIELCHATGASTVLDIGAGNQQHSNIFRQAGLNVTTNDILPSADIIGLYTDLPPFAEPFDAVWCAHTLEHQRNVGLFLDHIHADTKEGGVVSITVPPLKHNVVGGHLTLWNAGLLLYNMILARFDCSNALVATYDYNISVLVIKKTITLPSLHYDNGDIELLAPFFPVSVKQGFDGRLSQINWEG